MLNKLILIFLITSLKVFTCSELNNLNIYSQDTRTISLNYIQSYEGINRSNVEGQVNFEKDSIARKLYMQVAENRGINLKNFMNMILKVN